MKNKCKFLSQITNSSYQSRHKRNAWKVFHRKLHLIESSYQELLIYCTMYSFHTIIQMHIDLISRLTEHRVTVSFRTMLFINYWLFTNRPFENRFRKKVHDRSRKNHAWYGAISINEFPNEWNERGNIFQQGVCSSVHAVWRSRPR